jgi:hypothetical protein
MYGSSLVEYCWYKRTEAQKCGDGEQVTPLVNQDQFLESPIASGPPSLVTRIAMMGDDSSFIEDWKAEVCSS